MYLYQCIERRGIAVDSLEVAFDTLRPRQNGRFFPDDIFKCIFFNEHAWIALVPKVWINHTTSLVQIMAWRRPGAGHYLKQRCSNYWRIYSSLGLNELTHRLMTISRKWSILDWRPWKGYWPQPYYAPMQLAIDTFLRPIGIQDSVNWRWR